VATAMTGGSFVVACVVLIGLIGRDPHQYELTLFTWIPAGSFSVDIGFLLDPLSMTMVMFVTGVGALIHLYSIAYMHGDSRFPRFFLYLNLFVFSMLMLVLGDNLLLTFLGWEGVGACSYLLISFWFEDEANASAGKKAFVTNRVGDWGFMVATFAVFLAFGTLKYTEFLPKAGGLATTTATFIAFMLFVAAIGKSAQVPLFIWLPDAMAGPTPVSALIHAATMVTAGVFLLTRVNPIIGVSSSWLSWTIAIVGGVTALLAATIGMAQTDIKKVLAYSTVSQLGYLFLAIGSGAYVAAIFHTVTHAFFKALLFLGSGSVIHGMHGEQDMRRMGALRKFMPITAVTFIIGWLAIAGVPPLSGFWSKDEILEFAWTKSPALGVIGFAAALLTAFYMSRLVFLVFYGEPRWGANAASSQPVESAVSIDEAEPETQHEDATDAPAWADANFHPHESPGLMTVPLVILAGLAVVGGVLNLPFSHGTEFLTSWLEPVVEAGSAKAADGTLLEIGTNLKVAAGLISLVLALAGISLAWAIYLKKSLKAVEPKLFAKGWYIDDAITAFMGGPGRKGFEAVAWFDRTVIDGAVNGTGALVRTVAQGGRRVQTGYVRTYALGITLGAVVLLVIVGARMVIG
jgi:NADH-quinone oxidoreductase subunit L